MAHDRFVNSALFELQEANRSPIYGYQRLPILSLEEATKKIIPLVPRIAEFVAKAKENCNKNSDLLTHDESAAIYLYSMAIPFFPCLNNALRVEDRDALKPWFAFLKLFITTLEKLPSTTTTIWRGVSDDVSSEFVDNDKQTWWSVNSCSMALNVVEIYLGEKGTVFAIDAIHAKDISTFSAFPEEQEVVLMPGTRVRAKCKSLNFKNRFFLVSLEEENHQSESDHLVQLVKYEYTRNARIERIMNPAKSFPIEQSYINLAIVNAKEQYEKEKQLRDAQHGIAIMGAFEEIYGMKTVVDVKNIFHTCKTQEKQVLVFGRAGIGKSTFCRYVAYQWATGLCWSQYKLLALIPLRRLTANRYPPLPLDKSYSLIDVVKKEVFQYDLSEKDDKLLKKQFDAKTILWILDGYDEIVQNVPEHLQCLLEEIIKTPHHILTSRPYLNTLSYDVQMEITGFTDENITKYVQQFFDQMKVELENAPLKSQQLFGFLRSNPSIWGAAHIPVNLELICSLWSNEDWLETEELTITTLYSMMTEWLCRRYLTAQNIQIQKLSNGEVEQRCQKELAFLASLAFNAMESNTIILRPALLSKVLNEAKFSLQDHPHILNIGILKAFNKQGIGTQIETNKDHYFLHLSFQEYFAARHLINALCGSSKQKAIEFIKRQKYNQFYALVFTFASGLLSGSNVKPSLQIFWETIQAEPLDLVGIRHMQLAIACIEETSDKQTIPRRTELIESIGNCIKYSLSGENKLIRMQLLLSLQRAQSVACHPIIMNTFINLLQSDVTNTKTQALIFISELNLSDPSTALTRSIAMKLDDPNEKVRKNACAALGKMSEKAATNEVISKVVSALEDESEDVRRNGCDALGMMSEKAATNEVIGKLVRALGDESEDVRYSACETLAKMGEKAATNVVINKLVSVLGDESDHVRYGACEALGEMGEKAATNVVISKLMNALEYDSEDVRYSACEALGKMGEKAATNEVISKLVNALGDDSEDVRYSACEALGKMGEKAATNVVINKLVSVLGDESDHVRYGACEALGEMGEKAATNVVISKLMNALEYDSEDVRYSACEALGKMGEKAATNEVISKLVNALGDDSEDVRYSACEALGKMGEKAATNAVISKLVSALRDESDDVRYGACEALGEMGEKAAMNEVISKLVNALEDESDDVRYSACAALGKMGEKAATNEVINKLITILYSDNYFYAYATADAVGNILTLPAIVTQLGPEIILQLCLCERALECLKNISTNDLINIFFTTENSDWLSAVTLFTLCEGAAVTATENKVVVYGRNEPLDLSIPSLKLGQELINAFNDQAKRLHLFSDMPLEARNQSKVTSSFCQIM